MARNTIGSDINEILLAYELAKGWKIFDNPKRAKKALDTRRSQASPAVYRAQEGRAKEMAAATQAWMSANGWTAPIKKIWWTARKGDLQRAVEDALVGRSWQGPVQIATGGNPTDVLIQLDDDTLLGVSAKSTKKRGVVAFKNPGIGAMDKALGTDLRETYTNYIQAALPKIPIQLPRTQKERKIYIRSLQGAIFDKIEEAGYQALIQLRDRLLAHLQTMPEKQLRDHLVSVWLDAGSNYPYYIVATGYGTPKAGYGATIVDPIDNPKYKALMSGDISLVKVGAHSIGVTAGDTNILKMRFKYESQKLASSLKLSGDPY